MVFRIGWISMGARLSYEFGEKPGSITESGAWRQVRRAVGHGDAQRVRAGLAVIIELPRARSK